MDWLDIIKTVEMEVKEWQSTHLSHFELRW
jgi:hypothetical protein